MKARSRLKKQTKRVTGKVIAFSMIVTILVALLIGLMFAKSSLNEEPEMINPMVSFQIVKPVFATEIVTAEATPAASVSYGKTAKITAYSCGGLKTDAEIRMNCPSLYHGGPKTANGTTPIPYKTVACDRAYLNQYFEINGIGRVKCTDTGGAILGEGRCLF